MTSDEEKKKIDQVFLETLLGVRDFSLGSPFTCPDALNKYQWLAFIYGCRSIGHDACLKIKSLYQDTQFISLFLYDWNDVDVQRLFLSKVIFL